MKPPTYTPRELPVLQSATHLVLRLHIDGEWREKEVRPEGGETLRSLLHRFQLELKQACRHHHDLSRVCLYVATGEGESRMLASVPRDAIPVELHHG